MPNQFEDVLAQSKGAFEPQRAHSWIITFFDLPGARELELALQTAFLPSESNEEIEIPYMNARVYVAGKYTPESGSITFNDYVDANIIGILANWRKLVFDKGTGGIGLAANYKKTAEITLFGPDFVVERSFLIRGIWPQTINYGTPDYAGSEIIKTEVTFRYDKSEFQNIPGAA